jgi:hypothetical protein
MAEMCEMTEQERWERAGECAARVGDGRERGEKGREGI